MSLEKPHRMRVKALDGKPREPNKLKGQLAPHVDVIPAGDRVEFVICALKPHHLDEVRAKLAAAGLVEMPGGDTNVPPPAAAVAVRRPQGPQRSPNPWRRERQPQREAGEWPRLDKKPYAFVPLPETFPSAAPVWHDGTSSQGRFSGEIRFEMETLTPLLVGWERRAIADREADWPIAAEQVRGADVEAFIDRAARQVYPDDPNRQRRVEEDRREYIERMRNEVVEMPGVGWTIGKKSVLCPLRAPWGERPVIIPGDSIKGLLRHELGALLGAPMERVAERSYSYRPNLKFPGSPSGRRLEPRLARVVSSSHITVNGKSFRTPVTIDIFHMAGRHQQSYYPRRENGGVVQPPANAEPYRGGLGGGCRLPDECLSADARRRMIHTHLDASGINLEHRNIQIPDYVIRQYQRTLEHLLSGEHGHFSNRHPNVGTDQKTQPKCIETVREAARRAFQEGDLIWVEWDTQEKRVVSFGWHYYYRWAYQDTVRLKGWHEPRPGLFPLDEEKGDEPGRLTLVRRMFGYSGDNEGSQGIGQGDHGQLMGRISVNAALEVVDDRDTEEGRFLPPVFLKELGLPRPSAVEFYLKQPYYPNERPSDKARLVTYGDATGYDQPGELAGRKFYLDRADAYDYEPWQDDREANRLNERSTLAMDASRRRRRFRFTLRFRDLDAGEVASILLALCPNQFAPAVGGSHPKEGYCSKLGYARPLGWGTVRIMAKELHLLEGMGLSPNPSPSLTPVKDLDGWFRQHFTRPPLLERWLDIHQRKHPNAADYPTRNGQIYTFHAELRSGHTRLRRYAKEGLR